LTWEYINAFADMIRAAHEGYAAIEADTSSIKAQQDYVLLRQRGAYFLEQQQMPESFLDAFIPSKADVAAAINQKKSERQAQTEQAQAEQAQAEQAQTEQAQTGQAHNNLPPKGNTEAQCISTNCILGVVAEEIKGK
jgi:hypothetical protein